MGFFSKDMLPMLDTYQAEANELMEIFDRIVLSGERTNSFTADEINEVFRTAHTMKSSSAMMGLEDLSGLTHRMEDLFSLYRDDPQRIQGRVSSILDILFAYSDYVKGELVRMGDSDYVPGDVTDLRHRLDEAVAAQEGPAVAPAVAAPPAQAAVERAAAAPDIPASELAMDRQALVIYFADDCPMVNVRALVIMKQLHSLCRDLQSEPADLNDAGAAAQIYAKGLRLTFETAEPRKVLEKVQRNSYVRQAQAVYADAAPQPAPNPAPAPAATAPAVPAAVVQVHEGSAVKAEEKLLARDQEKFISIRWDDVLEIQNMAGEFIRTYSMLEKLLPSLPPSKDMTRFVITYERLLQELMRKVQSMSMISVATLTPQLYRIVREIGTKEGKDVNFDVIGEEIEIDRNLYDNITKPLYHIIRNAIDHGIEAPEERKQKNKPRRGTITLTVENQGSRVVFRVSDDGKGMDPAVLLAKAGEKGLLTKDPSAYTKDEALALVMLPGFSTSSTVTAYSGRGVGMDVVNAMMDSFGGTVTLDSEPDQGTAITLDVPVSVTSVQSQGFGVGPLRCFLPLHCIDHIFSGTEGVERIETADTGTLFTFDKKQIPMLYLPSLYGFSQGAGQDCFYIVAHSLDQRFCIVVDELHDQLMAIEKRLPAGLDSAYEQATGICNAVILNDGTVGFMLSANILYNLSLNGRPHGAAASARPVQLS